MNKIRLSWSFATRFRVEIVQIFCHNFAPSLEEKIFQIKGIQFEI